MKIGKKAAVLLLAGVLALAPASQAMAAGIPAAASSSVAAKKGWVTAKNGNTYYYKSGKKVTGITKIGKKTYAFNNKGVLQKNFKIYRVGKKYYSVNAKGVAQQFTGLAEKAAVRAYALAGKTNVTNKNARTTLFKAFQWCVGITYASVTVPSETTDQAMAEYYGKLGLDSRMGDCAVQAYTMYWLANAIGYKTKTINGYVYNSTADTYGEHSWCEVTQGGKTYILDANFNKEYFVNKKVTGLTEKSGFMQQYGDKNTLKYCDSEKNEIPKGGHA